MSKGPKESGIKVICSVCERPVDSVRTWTNVFMGREYFTVFCHGDFETVHLDQDILNIPGLKVNGFRALVKVEFLGVGWGCLKNIARMLQKPYKTLKFICYNLFVLNVLIIHSF